MVYCNNWESNIIGLSSNFWFKQLISHIHLKSGIFLHLFEIIKYSYSSFNTMIQNHVSALRQTSYILLSVWIHWVAFWSLALVCSCHMCGKINHYHLSLTANQQRVTTVKIINMKSSSGIPKGCLHDHLFFDSILSSPTPSAVWLPSSTIRKWHIPEKSKWLLFASGEQNGSRKADTISVPNSCVCGVQVFLKWN